MESFVPWARLGYSPSMCKDSTYTYNTYNCHMQGQYSRDKLHSHDAMETLTSWYNVMTVDDI